MLYCESDCRFNKPPKLWCITIINHDRIQRKFLEEKYFKCMKKYDFQTRSWKSSPLNLSKNQQIYCFFFQEKMFYKISIITVNVSFLFVIKSSRRFKDDFIWNMRIKLRLLSTKWWWKLLFHRPSLDYL